MTSNNFASVQGDSEMSSTGSSSSTRAVTEHVATTIQASDSTHKRLGAPSSNTSGKRGKSSENLRRYHMHQSQRSPSSVGRPTRGTNSSTTESEHRELAINAEEAIDAQKHIFALEAGEELRTTQKRIVYLVNNLHIKLQTQSLESSSRSSNFEAIETDLQRRLVKTAQMECRNYVEFRSKSAFLCSR